MCLSIPICADEIRKGPRRSLRGLTIALSNAHNQSFAAAYLYQDSEFHGLAPRHVEGNYGRVKLPLVYLAKNFLVRVGVLFEFGDGHGLFHFKRNVLLLGGFGFIGEILDKFFVSRESLVCVNVKWYGCNLFEIDRLTFDQSIKEEIGHLARLMRRIAI